MKLHLGLQKKLSDKEEELLLAFFLGAQLFEYNVFQGSNGFDIVRDKYNYENKWSEYRLIISDVCIEVSDMVSYSQFPIPDDRFTSQEFKTLEEAIAKIAELMWGGLKYESKLLQW